MKKSATKTAAHRVDTGEIKKLLTLHNADIKQHTRKLIVESRKETERYMGALSEEFQGRVAGIAEQFNGLNKKLDDHDKQFVKIDGQLRVIHLTLGAMKEDMEIMKEYLDMIKADVRKRITYEEFQSLIQRVALLEKKAHRTPSR